MRILLTSISTVEGEAPELEALAQVLSEIGHQADIFIAPPKTSIHNEFGYLQLKKQLKRTIDLMMPDVIECSGVDAIAYALGELGYAYIVNISEQIKDFELTPENDGTQPGFLCSEESHCYDGDSKGEKQRSANLLHAGDKIRRELQHDVRTSWQKEIIRHAGFIFTENERQKRNLAETFHIDNAKLVTMPITDNSHMVAERLAYYQQMLVRHFLH